MTAPSPVHCYDDSVYGLCENCSHSYTYDPGCSYDEDGDASKGYRYKRWTNKNDSDCNHVPPPPANSLVEDSACPPQCHTPIYKVFWRDCDSNRGEEVLVKDTNIGNRVKDQPICQSALPYKHGWTGYTYNEGSYDMCVYGGEYGDDPSDYVYSIKSRRDNTGDLNAAMNKGYTLTSFDKNTEYVTYDTST